MFGTGLLKGLGVTMKRLVETYIDDVRAIPSRYASGQDMIRQLPDERGIFTIQYPEEKRQIPERFRYIPMLIYDTPKGEDRCTACGICAKVCPPQCIWIVRDQDEKGKPIPRAAEFYIDASICMSCGFCAEFCPFDAIKMNHDYELAVYQRYPNLIYDMQELTVPLEYYAALYPTQFAEEEARRAEEEAKKAAKAAQRGAKATGGAKPAAKAPPVQPAAEAPAAQPAAEAPAAQPAAEAPTAQPAAEAPTAQPAAEAPTAQPAAEAEPVVEAAPEAKAEPPAAEPPPQAAAKAAPAKGGRKPWPATAHSSGTLDWDELERRRVEAHARYRERKGGDAKILDDYVK